MGGELKTRDKILSRLDRMLWGEQDPYPNLDAGRKRYFNRELRRYRANLGDPNYHFAAPAQLSEVLKDLIEENGLLPVMQQLSQHYQDDTSWLDILNGVQTLPARLNDMIRLSDGQLERQIMSYLIQQRPNTQGNVQIKIRHLTATIPQWEIRLARNHYRNRAKL